jgi:trehalose synthase
MTNLSERLGVVPVTPQPIDRFAAVLETDEYHRLLETTLEGRELLAGRIVWNVNSAARGGGVAEMLASLLPLAKGAGVDARWLVVLAPSEFFKLTKRIHNELHGTAVGPTELGLPERVLYEASLEPHAEALESIVRSRDIVVLHDPQTAGLVPAVRRTGARVLWRCHIGVDHPNQVVRRAWDFLLPYVAPADAYIFSRAEYAWEGLRRDRVVVVPPSIDAFSSKNLPLSPEQVSGILAKTGIAKGHGGDTSFSRLDGSAGRVERRTDLLGSGPVPEDADIVTQISRWDRLKDPFGVVEGFVQYTASLPQAHLVVAGPSVSAVSDDPEGFEVVQQMMALWARLPAKAQEKVHLACLPMEDVEENATIVNALQRRASIVVQKSLAEGFGLTVAEAMWKERAIVASRVGGLQDQIIDGESGILVEPSDLTAYGRAMTSLLEDPEWAERLGRAARQRCRREYLAPGHLIRYVTLLDKLLG